MTYELFAIQNEDGDDDDGWSANDFNNQQMQGALVDFTTITNPDDKLKDTFIKEASPEHCRLAQLNLNTDNSGCSHWKSVIEDEFYGIEVK
jgi:hypothetical protein